MRLLLERIDVAELVTVTSYCLYSSGNPDP